ncbi:unnamed protein product [Vitrella brassicaformis CCMP3155]|uniref:Uncharacterized protein n=1 Tax=Vitrella brassicaformis (strain CCMP3155) TaxID=1169540 RepID=A0A0G4EVB7_VITBC|nr:unnamed protein product [Vitrella brassicaformis CCMP3155]|eukprot:CEM02004.1 unnamed protein product [Vitrella brassicaformis CCMP3155]
MDWIARLPRLAPPSTAPRPARLQVGRAEQRGLSAWSRSGLMGRMCPLQLRCTAKLCAAAADALVAVWLALAAYNRLPTDGWLRWASLPLTESILICFLGVFTGLSVASVWWEGICSCLGPCGECFGWCCERLGRCCRCCDKRGGKTTAADSTGAAAEEAASRGTDAKKEAKEVDGIDDKVNARICKTLSEYGGKGSLPSSQPSSGASPTGRERRLNVDLQTISREEIRGGGARDSGWARHRFRLVRLLLDFHFRCFRRALVYVPRRCRTAQVCALASLILRGITCAV